MNPEYTSGQVYPCQTCPYLMQGQCMNTPYMQSPFMAQAPYVQMPAAGIPNTDNYEEMKEEEDGPDNNYRQLPFGPRPFFGPRPPFFGPRPPFFPPPFYGPRPFFPPPFYGGAPFGFGFPFLTGLALGGLLF